LWSDDWIGVGVFSSLFIPDHPVEIASCFKSDPVIAFGQIGKDFLEDGTVDILELGGSVVPHLPHGMVQETTQGIQRGVSRLQLQGDVPNLVEQTAAAPNMVDGISKLDCLDIEANKLTHGER
jgi:hypothetical protein